MKLCTTVSKASKPRNAAGFMNTLIHKLVPPTALIVACLLPGCSDNKHNNEPSRGSVEPSALVTSSIQASKGQVQANGITIAYESFGPAERETVLLIMGISVQLTAWPVEFTDELVRRGYRVVVYDNGDVGLSTKFDAAGTPDWGAIFRAKAEHKPGPVAYTIDDMARDAVGLLDALGIKKAHIVGASMGGHIAQLVAADHPEHTLSLTSIMSSTLNPALPQPKPEAMAAMRMPNREGDPEGYAADMIKIWKVIGSPGYPTDERTIRERTFRDFQRSYHPAGGVRQAAAIFATGDLRTKLKTIKAPTVVLPGADDPIVSVEGGKDTAANIPGAELRIIPGLGHDLPLPLVTTFADAVTAAAFRATGRTLAN